MKRRFPAALCVLSLLLLPSCADSRPPADPPPADPPPAETVTDSDRAAYLARIDELTDTVLTLRQESFIQKAEYEARVSALLEEIAALKARLALMDSPDSGTDLPVSGHPSESPADTAPSSRPTAPPQTAPAPSAAFHFEIRNGHAVIVAYLGDQPHVRVPAAIEGYPVTAIEENAFKSTSVVTVELPYSLTHIGWFAFADCPSLTAVTLPASVENIGYGAFDGCTHLTLICPADSYAAQYAQSFAIPHKEE